MALPTSYPGRNVAIVNMTHIETPLDPFDAAAKQIDGKEQADRTLVFLRGRVSGGVRRGARCAPTA